MVIFASAGTYTGYSRVEMTTCLSVAFREFVRRLALSPGRAATC
jgi:hypothetical protein